MVGKTKELEAREPNMRKIGQIKLPPWAKSIVRVPVTPGSPLVGVTNKCDLQGGVILAASLTKVVDGYVMMSILSTNDTEVDMQEPLVELDEIHSAWDRSCSTVFESEDREWYSDTIKVRTFKYGRKKTIGSSTLRLPGYIVFAWW